VTEPAINSQESTEVQDFLGSTERTTAQVTERRGRNLFISYTYESDKELATAFQDFIRPTEQVIQQDQQTRSDRSYADRAVAEPIQLPIRLRELPPRSVFAPIEEWEGTVLSVEPDSFIARLVNKSGSQVPEEEGQFTMAQLSSTEDRGLVAPGSIFYFSIGYEESPSGQRRTSAFLRFRRLPAWTSAELKVIEAEADRLAEVFGSSAEQGQVESG
jgi:hypothetical protein